MYTWGSPLGGNGGVNPWCANGALLVHLNSTNDGKRLKAILN